MEDFEYNHTETSSDGSVLYCQRDEKGLNLPPSRGVIQKVDKVKDMEIRDDDVIILTQPKSGTHWVANIINLLLHKGDLDKHNWTTNYFFLENPRTDETEAPSPRILISHLINDYLPLKAIAQSKARLIMLNRDLKDILVSGYAHAINTGLMKGTMKGLMEISFRGQAYYVDRIQRMMFYSKYQTELGARGLYLNYEEIRQEPEKYVQVLADHVGVTLTDSEISKILDKTSVDNMKKHVKEPDNFVGAMSKIIYRKGDIGDWKDHFTVAFNEWFDVEHQKIQDYFLQNYQS